MNHEDNCFRTRILGTIADTVVFSPIYVYYKEGVPDQRKTAVKICIRTNPDWMRKSNLIGIKYIDGLCVGESFSYQPEPEFAGVYGFVYDIFVYDKMNTDNQLAVSSLSENVDENQINVYYTGQFTKFRSKIDVCYYDAKTMCVELF